MRRRILLLLLACVYVVAVEPSPGPVISDEARALATGDSPEELAAAQHRLDNELRVSGWPVAAIEAESVRLTLERDRLQAEFQAFIAEAGEAVDAHNHAGSLVSDAYQSLGEKGNSEGLLISGGIYFNAPSVIAIDKRIWTLDSALHIMSSTEKPEDRSAAVVTIALASFIMEQRKAELCTEQVDALRATFTAARAAEARARDGF